MDRRNYKLSMKMLTRREPNLKSISSICPLKLTAVFASYQKIIDSEIVFVTVYIAVEAYPLPSEYAGRLVTVTLYHYQCLVAGDPLYGHEIHHTLVNHINRCRHDRINF